MEEPTERNLAFYHSLGKLFYAVASIDKVVRDKELEKLQSCVSTYWLDLDDLEDSFNCDAAYLIEIVFDGSIGFELLSEDAYWSFVKFNNEQKQLFTPQVNSLILKTARAIAGSFSGVNKSELILLAKLELELNK